MVFSLISNFPVSSVVFCDLVFLGATGSCVSRPEFGLTLERLVPILKH